MRKISSFAVTALLTIGLVLSGCGGSGAPASSSAAGSTAASSSGSSAAADKKIDLKDGTYTAKFTTDSTMFHVNEVYKERGTLTVKDGKATLHVTLASTSIVKLFVGSAEDAQKDGAKLLEGKEEAVKYPDGTSDKANAFDIPVPVIDAEFDCALVGTKGKWYDHKVKVSDVKEGTLEGGAAGSSAAPEGSSKAVSDGALNSATGIKDGEYKIDVTCEGGTGKGGVDSAVLIVKDSKLTAKLIMSSDKYTKMVVDGQTYQNKPEGGKSTFTVPVSLDNGIAVKATTEAMSTPHDVDYTVTLNSGSLPSSAMK